MNGAIATVSLLALWHFAVASLLSFLSTGVYVLAASFFVVLMHYKGEFPEGNEAANATLSVLLSLCSFSPLPLRAKERQREGGTEKGVVAPSSTTKCECPPSPQLFHRLSCFQPTFPTFCPLLLLLFVRIGGGPTLTILPPDFLEIKKERRATKTKDEKEGGGKRRSREPLFRFMLLSNCRGRKERGRNNDN